jgi:hypothetical protein
MEKERDNLKDKLALPMQEHEENKSMMKLMEKKGMRKSSF